MRPSEPHSTQGHADESTGDAPPGGLSDSHDDGHGPTDYPAHPGQQQDPEEEPRAPSDEGKDWTVPTRLLRVELGRLAHDRIVPDRQRLRPISGARLRAVVRQVEVVALAGSSPYRSPSSSVAEPLVIRHSPV